jgi:hypothetical protein
MISGRYPIYPESSVTAQKNLDQWGKVPVSVEPWAGWASHS